MPRFFVAIPLPNDTRDCLVAVQPAAVPGMRLLGREELHLTLHFLGEVAPEQDDAVRKALESVKVSAFAISINGVGGFPPEGQAKVLWSGIESSPPLLTLHHSIGAALSNAIGFRPEDRPYSPHVTLARLNTPAPPHFVEQYLDEQKGFMIPPVLLKEFALYSSVVVDNVPRYHEEAAFPFALGSTGN